jgi:Ca2+-binding RTX toxin-like protein
VNWTNIDGAMGATCTLTQSEVGLNIRAVASYTDDYGTRVSVRSIETDVVAPGNQLNDSLSGNAGDNTFDGSVGNDTLNGGLSDDLYRFSRGGGQDTIGDLNATVGNSDVLAFSGDVSYDQLWFGHIGNDLDINGIGSADAVINKSWYSGSDNHVEQIRSGDGKVLVDANLNALVQAMSTMTAPVAGQTVLPPATQAQLAPVLAANWN